MTRPSFQVLPSFGLVIASTLLLSPLLGGCAVAVVGGVAAAGGAGYEAAQERGVNGTFDDFNLQSQINNAMNNRFGDVTTTVYAGKVLLTGSSPTPLAKYQAEQIARATPGVAGVFNEIDVGPSEEAWQVAKDAWITARVRSDLVFDANVRSSNYTIETDRQSVYLMGSARSQAELERAAQLARYVPGVQRVVSYVDIRYGEPNGVQPGTAQASIPAARAGGAMSTPAAPAPSASAPIQVQRLN